MKWRRRGERKNSNKKKWNEGTEVSVRTQRIIEEEDKEW